MPERAYLVNFAGGDRHCSCEWNYDLSVSESDGKGRRDLCKEYARYSVCTCAETADEVA